MTRKQLKQLRHLKSEINILKKQIEDVELVVVTDKVRGSSTEHPYTERSYEIRGIDYPEYKAKTARLRKALQQRVDELINMVTEINKYIQGIDDSLIRQIITLRHINGLTWERVAELIGGGNTADSVRKMHDRYFEGRKPDRREKNGKQKV